MHEIVNVNPNICRICLKSGIDLRFGIEDCTEMVLKVAQVQLAIIDNENIPNHVCNPCFQMLVVANDIRSRCLQSKEFFDNFLQLQAKTEGEIEDEVVVYELDNEEEYISEEGQSKMEQDEEEYEQEYTEEPILDKNDDMHIEYLETDGLDLEIGEEADEEEVTISIENYAQEITSTSKLIEPPQRKITSKRKLRYGCCQCQFEAAMKADIKSHFNDEHLDKYSHEPTSGHVCYLCNLGFETRTEMLQHNNAPRLNQFPCDTCDLTFNSEFKLQRHYDKDHPGKHLFACEFCDKVYDKQATLNHHKYIQHDERSIFECNVCLKVFHRKSFFKEHMNAHLGIRNYQCPQCPSKFSRRTNLQAHIRSHTGERPYKCPHCSKTYSHCTDLKRHSYTHTNQWPFVCVTCGKGFAKKSAVEAHVKQHGVEGGYYTQGASKEDNKLTKIEEVMF